MTTHTPVIGETVVTADGEVIGKVSEVQEGCFKVDKPMRADQWLGTDVIASAVGDVRLSVTRQELEGDPEGIEHLGFHVHRRM